MLFHGTLYTILYTFFSFCSTASHLREYNKETDTTTGGCHVRLFSWHFKFFPFTKGRVRGKLWNLSGPGQYAPCAVTAHFNQSASGVWETASSFRRFYLTKADCFVLRTLAITADIRKSAYGLFCSYRLARPISMPRAMQACPPHGCRPELLS